MSDDSSFLQQFPPMGIYKTLYAFWDAFGSYMGGPGTHPWSQGFPRTTQLPGGPPLPTTVTVSAEDRMYPKAWGLPALREAIAGYYRSHYNATIDAENVMIFAGGRPALAAILLFMRNAEVRIASTEYTPYYDLLERLERPYRLIESSADNKFRPALADYVAPPSGDASAMALLSNPCNPTGITRTGDELRQLVETAKDPRMAVLCDEAYEMFHEPPVSSLEFVDDIDASNLFVVGAATKGLQAPGIRIGWVVAARKHIEILGNFSSFGMGGVSHPSQCYAVDLFEPERVRQARAAVPRFYGEQRARYGQAFEQLGLELFSGDGGFYHWCRLPGDLTAAELNRRLFKSGAAILEGTDCDMARLGESGPLAQFLRFSFGPLHPDSFEKDIEILARALGKK